MIKVGFKCASLYHRNVATQGRKGITTIKVGIIETNLYHKAGRDGTAQHMGDGAFAEKKRRFAENQWRALLIGWIFGIFGGKCIFKP